MAGGLEQRSWGLERVSEGLGGSGLERAEGLGSGGGAGPSGDVRTDVRSDVRSDVRTDGKFTPLSYRTSSPSGTLPKNRVLSQRLNVNIFLIELIIATSICVNSRELSFLTSHTYVSRGTQLVYSNFI